MRTIAYRQANHPKSVVWDSLPPDHITEYCYVDEVPAECIKTEDGWQTLPEDQFKTLHAQVNHPDRLKEFAAARYAKQLEKDENGRKNRNPK